MELTNYVRILRKRWWIIVVAVVLTAGSAFVFSKLQHPEYTSTAEVIIEPARSDWGLAQYAKMLLRTYMTVTDSDQWAQEVIDLLELPMTPQQLRSNAHFAAEDDRMVIKLEIEDYDGDQANDALGDRVAVMEMAAASELYESGEDWSDTEWIYARELVLLENVADRTLVPLLEIRGGLALRRGHANSCDHGQGQQAEGTAERRSRTRGGLSRSKRSAAYCR